MKNNNAVIAVFTDHQGAEAAVKQLVEAGIGIKHLSVLGMGYYTDEKSVKFATTDDCEKFWGARGAFWGGLWSRLRDGVFMFVPVIGHVYILGHLASAVFTAIGDAVVNSGLSALSTALSGSGIPQDSVITYEIALKADSFLVTAHGHAEEMARAKEVLGTLGASRVDLHEA